MVRVALDVTPLAGQRTGIGLFVSELVRGLDAIEAISVCGLAMTARGRDSIAAQLPNGIRMSRPAPARLLRKAWGASAVPPVEWLTGPVDLVHGTNYVVPPARRAASLVTIHDLAPWHSPELVHPSSLQYPSLVQRAIATGAHVHTVSAFVGDEVRSMLGIESDRIHVIPNGIAQVPRGTSEAGHRRVCAGPYVLALGTNEPRKGFVSLVRSFAELGHDFPELTLAIAGGPGWGREPFEEAILAEGLENRVVELGYVSEADKADLFAGAELLVSAATYEGFGLVPLEAMAAGVPVVAASGGSIAEVCGDAAILVPPGDESMLTQAMERALSDESWRREAVLNGEALAAKFSWKRTVGEFSDLYAALVAS